MALGVGRDFDRGIRVEWRRKMTLDKQPLTDVDGEALVDDDNESRPSLGSTADGDNANESTSVEVAVADYARTSSYRCSNLCLVPV